jgi:hypothetical protein
MAVAYRFLDATHFDKQFRDSLTRHGSAPEMPERYRQERYLFGFFVSGVSAIESLCYGLCAIAWEAEPNIFSLASLAEKRQVTPKWTQGRFCHHFPKDAITRELTTVLDSPEYVEWAQLRNALAHRTSPARTHYRNLGSASPPEPPSEWGALTLDPDLTAGRRLWLRGAVATLLADGGRFAAAHF